MLLTYPSNNCTSLTYASFYARACLLRFTAAINGAAVNGCESTTYLWKYTKCAAAAGSLQASITCKLSTRLDSYLLTSCCGI